MTLFISRFISQFWLKAEKAFKMQISYSSASLIAYACIYARIKDILKGSIIFTCKSRGYLDSLEKINNSKILSKCQLINLRVW